MRIIEKIRDYFYRQSLQYCILCKKTTVERLGPRFKQAGYGLYGEDAYYIRYYHPECLEKVFADPENHKDVLDKALWLEECIENKKIEEQGKLQDAEELLQKVIKKAKERS